jgi:glycosyltransferase involved in cell wall biosynthesis
MAPGRGVDPGIDILVVSVPGTLGWVTGARELAAAFTRTGARTAHIEAPPPRQVRTLMLTDLVQASAARKAALVGAGEHRPDAIVYCSTTAALLWDRPGVVWLDATAAENRPGRHGWWQRPLERRRLARAPFVLTWSEAALDGFDGPHGEQVVIPVPVQASGPIDAPRDLAAVAYAADPEKRRLELLLDFWRRARREDETLVVAGIERPDEPGVRFAGRVGAEEYRALLRRARLFVAAPRREEYGIAALEALADGARLVTTPAAGAYPALALARSLDPRLVGEDLVPAIRTALDAPPDGYAARAAQLLAPYRRDAVSATLSQRVLPTLLPGWRG